MDKNSAINLIDKTFNKAFDEAKFTNFIQNLLNDFEIKPYKASGNTIWEDQRDHISYYKRIGKYIDPEGEALDVLIVQVKNVSKLERARTALRNFVIKHLNNFEKDYALVAFYSKEDDGFDWRFSFIKMEYQSYLDEEKQKVKMRKEFTPAKRYSFLVGEYEKSHTAKTQLLPLLQNIANNPTIAELEKAFSIERVTDEFFEQYKNLYIKVYEHFDKQDVSIFEDGQLDASGFTKKLLGQIVFLYFLQKKGWLGVPKNEKWGAGKRHFLQQLFDDSLEKNKNFFKDYLQYLFYEALAKERDNDNSFYPRFNCRIPFLNGSLFEAQYDWQNANISIPQDFFRSGEENEDKRTGILDVFDRYNFTIKEDEPLDKEVAVDPEMLGKVFENMLEITERKSKGAFYTPREIVHYMCQESLIHYLDNALNNYNNSYQEFGSDQTNMFGNEAKNGQQSIQTDSNEFSVPKEDIEEYIREGHLYLENDTRVAERGETKTYKYKLADSIINNADIIDKKLTEIRICDPAIGSGAFPVGLLHELVTAQLVLKPHLSYNYLNDKLKHFDFQERESVSESRYVYRLKKHIIQESIYGVDIDRSAIDIARLRLWLSLVVDESDLEPIETLPNLDYKIVCGNSLIGMPDGTMRDLKVEKELEGLKEEFYTVTNEKRKKELRDIINTKIRELLDSAETFAGYDIDFDFKLFFSEVWKKSGGFDIVIGNPPYSVYQGYKKNELEILKKIPIYENAKGRKLNAFELFLCLSPTLLKKRGNQCFIFQNSFLADTSSKKLRKYYFEYQSIIKIDSFPERDDVNKRVFESAKMSVCILQSINAIPNEKKLILEIWEERYMINSKHIIFNIDDLTKLDSQYFSIPSVSNEEYSVLKKLSFNRKVSDIGHCFEGEINLTTAKKFLFDEQNTGFYKMIKGASVQKWVIRDKMSQGVNQFLDPKFLLGKNKSSKAFHHQQTRIVLQGITGVDEKYRIKMAILEKSIFCGNSANYILFNDSNINLKSYTALFNSSVINWLFKCYSTNSNVNGYEVDNLPLPFEDNVSLEKIYDYLNFILDNNLKEIIDNSFFELLNDTIVFELYFPIAFETANKTILKHLSDLKPINDTMSDEEKLGIIQSEYERLYHPDHPVRYAIETLDSIEEVRIIREALK